MKKCLTISIAVLLLVVLLCACGGSGKPLSGVFDDIKAEVTIENANEFDDVSLLERYYGITEDMVDEFAGCINSTGVEQEEIVLIKAKDAASADTVEEKLNNRLEAKRAQNKDYNPQQYEMMEGCKVERYDLYVSMIVSENAEKITEIYKKDLGL